MSVFVDKIESAKSSRFKKLGKIQWILKMKTKNIQLSKYYGTNIFTGHVFWCISLMDLLFIAMRFEMKKKVLNVCMIHTIYRTQCSFGNRYTKFQCKSWMNKRSLWTNPLYHIMSNRIANSLTISTLLVRNSIGYRNWCCCCIYHTFTNCT